MPVERFRIIPEVHLILRRGDSILMLRRFNTGYMDGHYSLIAGHVDGAETFRAAMVREAREEAGIDLSVQQLRLVHTMHRRAETERLSLFFETSGWRGTIMNNEPDKCDDIGWFPLHQKRAVMVPYVAAAIDAVADGQSYCEFGWHD